MKTLTSKVFLFVANFLILGFIFSYSVLAVSSNKNLDKSNNSSKVDMESKKTDNSQRALDRICQRIENSYSKILERSQGLENRIKTRREQREENYTKRIQEQEQNIERVREQVDENFEENIEKMMSQAQTDEQKKAVENFKASVEAVRNVRRAVVEEAQETFRVEVQNQIRNRQQNIEGLISDFKVSLDSAFKTAKTACEEGRDIKEIRESFRSSIKTAHEKFQNEEQNRERIGENISQAAKVKNEARKKANQEFKTALEEAIRELQKYFPDSQDE